LDFLLPRTESSRCIGASRPLGAWQHSQRCIKLAAAEWQFDPVEGHDMARMRSLWRLIGIAWAASLVLLAGCGGGGESSPAPAANQVPIIALSYGITARQSSSGAVQLAIGNAIDFDASASIDPDGDALRFEWSVTVRPAGSTASVTSSAAARARFVPDILGDFTLLVRAIDSRGAAAERSVVVNVTHQAPLPAVAASINPAGPPSTTNLSAPVGYEVILNASSTTDADGDALSFTWELSARPGGSSAALGSISGPATLFAPDVLGTYVVRMRVQDARGAYSDHLVNVEVNNRRPTISFAANATPIPIISVAPIRVPIGATLLLQGGDSTDPDGDSLTFTWDLTSRPPGSAASLTSAGALSRMYFTPDVAGAYTVRLRVTDSRGALAERTVLIETGNSPPRAILDKARAVVLVGTAVDASAALSFDDDGDALSFAWSFDMRPSGSAAMLSGTSNANASFVPDVAGTYVVRVAVSAAGQTSSALLTVVVRAASLGSVALPQSPTHSAYSRGLDLFVFTTTSPATLRSVDPATGVIRAVVLPLAPKALAISANGRRAAIAHNAAVSYVDLESSTLIRTVSSTTDHTEVFLADTGYAYLIGQTGGQWVYPAVTVVDLNAGAIVQQVTPGGFNYGTQRGVFADRKGRALYVAEGISPSDISYFDISSSTRQVTVGGDSPYHGDYSIGGPLWLTSDQETVFTRYGTYFRTSDLTYAGALASPPSYGFRSMSHEGAQDELLGVEGEAYWYGSTVTLSDSYYRYTGPFFSRDANLPLPAIDGQAAYALAVFHSSVGNHVLLVQTGSNELGSPSAQYRVMYR
jgi:hypothetical protein